MNGKTKRLGLFIGITFALSWLIAILFFTLGGEWNTRSAMIVATAFMFMPMVSAVLIQKILYKEPLKKPLGISFRLNRWFLVAWGSGGHRLLSGLLGVYGMLQLFSRVTTILNILLQAYL